MLFCLNKSTPMFFRIIYKSLPQVTVSSRQFTCIYPLINIEKKDVRKSGKIPTRYFPELSLFSAMNSFLFTNQQRFYAKKRKGSRQNIQDEDSESDNEDEDIESVEPEEVGDGSNLVTKNVPSLRLDSVIKAGLGISKKKVEKEFYASKVRVNGEKVMKKGAAVYLEDEIDVVIGPSPENRSLLLVDRINLKSVGKLTGSDQFPVKMQVFKSLTIENYSDPWVKSSQAVSDID